jgi:hypothetical protein
MEVSVNFFKFLHLIAFKFFGLNFEFLLKVFRNCIEFALRDPLFDELLSITDSPKCVLA